MAGERRGIRPVKAPARALVSVDGLNGRAVLVAARQVLAVKGRPRRHDISRWDASRLFDQLWVAGGGGGTPSARTLLLLYAADLAFRLRWEIEPALADGRTVVAAPYVDTAKAFGRAAGLSAGWLASLFQFAPPPDERRYVDAPVPRSSRAPDGFIEFSCARLAGVRSGLTRHELATRIRANLRKAAARARAR